jgi:hypothetical protein
MSPSQSETDPLADDQPEAHELSNPQPEIAQHNNEVPRTEAGAEDLYPDDQGEPPDSVAESEGMGEHVIAENRERNADK